VVQKHALFIALSVATATFALVHIFPELYPVRVLWYYPLERRWAFELAPSGLAMAWYGRSLLAMAVAVAVFAGALAIAQRRSGATKLGLQSWAAGAATAAVLTMTAYTWCLVQRRPASERVPEGRILENCGGD
jgi:hypothetical protein